MLFEFDSAELAEVAREPLADIATDIPHRASVSVDGHTDSIGEDAYNDDLPQSRADAVGAVLGRARPGPQVERHRARGAELIVRNGEGDQSSNRTSRDLV
ncbi:OmpA family protein [Microbacterium sp. NPDC096154]|uniref:OmpA family protein n=1 Tax=Microbacterium sp. NPDC096154 TaxID=3155549 RepID=UPI00331737FE